MREAINGTQFLFLLKEAKPTLKILHEMNQKKKVNKFGVTHIYESRILVTFL